MKHRTDGSRVRPEKPEYVATSDYRPSRPGVLRVRASEDIYRRQIEDLKTAVAHFRKLPGALSVEAHFARVRGGHVAFELVGS